MPFNNPVTDSNVNVNLTTAPPGASAPGDIIDEGTSQAFSRADHRHGREAGATVRTAVPLRAGWTNYGGGYQGLVWSKAGGLVVANGLIAHGANDMAYRTSYPAADLPVGARPAAHLLVAGRGQVHSGTSTVEIYALRWDITAEGVISFYQDMFTAGAARMDFGAIHAVFPAA